MHEIQLMKEDPMNLKECEEWCMEGFRRSKGKEKRCNYKFKNKKNYRKKKKKINICHFIPSNMERSNHPVFLTKMDGTL